MSTDSQVNTNSCFKSHLIEFIKPGPNDVCKICFFSQVSENNPLISVCKCKGTLQLIHLNCLNNWIETKIIKKEDDELAVYFFKNYQCEICLAPFPCMINLDSISYKGNEISLLKLAIPHSPFLMLELTQKDKGVLIYLIKPLKNREFKIGRGHESDLKLSDLSISRDHAIISYNNEIGFTISDNNSRFGTFVKTNTLKLTELSSYAIQIGSTVASISLNPVKPLIGFDKLSEFDYLKDSPLPSTISPSSSFTETITRNDNLHDSQSRSSSNERVEEAKSK